MNTLLKSLTLPFGIAVIIVAIVFSVGLIRLLDTGSINVKIGQVELTSIRNHEVHQVDRVTAEDEQGNLSTRRTSGDFSKN